MTVSLVLLSYDRPHLLREALASAGVQTYRPAEIIVVDNRSPRSDEIARVVAEFPGVRLIANPTNQGFTGGMNTGLRAASGDYIILSEDDILLAPEAIRAIVHHLEENPEVGLAGGLMLNKESGTVRYAGGQIRVGGLFEMILAGEGELYDGRYTTPFPVTYIPGAFIAARRGVWTQLNGFRERYYLYMEDVDLCLRAAAAGWRLDVVPTALLWHFDPLCSGQPPGWLNRLKRRNLLRLYALNAPVWVLPEFLLRYCGSLVLRDLFRGRQEGWNAGIAFTQTLLELPALLWDRWATDQRPGTEISGRV